MSESAFNLGQQLPILQVVMPMLAAPLCLVLRHARATWCIALAVTAAAFATSCLLLQRTMAEGVVSYQVGGWPPPWGIELSIEPLSALVLLVVSGISVAVVLAAPRSLQADLPRERHYLFFAAYLLCMTGLLGMTSAGDAFNVFVFLEISSLASYGLIALGPSRRALISAFRYLIIGTTGGTFILLGVGLLYQLTGTLNIADLAARLPPVAESRTVLVALAVIVAGTGIKMALFPLHFWLPNAYTFAPAVVTAFLAATATKVAFFVQMRFVFRVFGVELAFGRLHLDAVLMPLALLAMLLASTVAVFQRDVKRMLAYSSVAQVGYMVLGLSLASVTGLTGGIVHVFNHALMKSGLFLALAAVALRLGSTRLADFAGLGRRMPLTIAAFVVGGASLVGVPLTAGFISKWFLVSAALEAGRWVVAAIILFSSLLALVYVGRVVEVAYFKSPPAGEEAKVEAPASLLLPTWGLIGATVVFGIYTPWSAGVAARAAAFLLGGGP